MSKGKLIIQNELIKAINEMDFFYYQLCNIKGRRNGKTKALVDYERACAKAQVLQNLLEVFNNEQI